MCMDSGGGVTWREWEMGGRRLDQGKGNSFTGPVVARCLQDLCWPISNHCLGYSSRCKGAEKSWKIFLKTTSFSPRLFPLKWSVEHWKNC